MALKKLQFLPGIVKSISDYAAPGRYVDAQWTRFVDGFAQKKGGWVPTDADRSLSGVCRNICTWRDNSEISRAAFATHIKLFVLAQGTIEDVTPLRGRNTGTLAGALTTTNGSNVVTVDHTAHGQKVGDWVTLTAETAVADVLVRGNFLIDTLPDADSYTIIAASAATSSTTGGGDVEFIYYRFLLDPDPIATVDGSSIVTIADAANLCAEGDTVIFDAVADVGGIVLDGPYVILSATVDGYEIDAGTVATSTTTGGGSEVYVENEITGGLVSTIQGQGYGVGLYGMGPYGTPRSTSVTLMLRSWALASYGEWLLANPRGGYIYVWDPAVGGRAVRLYGSPAALSFFVTTERYIVALGTDGDSMRIAWADQLDPTAWIATPSNTANESRKVLGGSFLVSGTQVRNQTSIIWTDRAAFLHQWRSDDYVFTTTLLADRCGILGPNAYTVEGEVVYWWGDGHFWKWDGAITEVASDDIQEWFFRRINREQNTKIVMGSIAAFGEVITLYQDRDEDEIGHYLLYNCQKGIWSAGTLQRTAWVDRTLFVNPMATDASGAIFDHEVGLDAADEPLEAWITAAPMDIDTGDETLDILGFLPDLARQTGTLSLYVLVRERAEDTPDSLGPFNIQAQGAMLDLRANGHMAGYKLESNELGGDFRIGVCRVEVQPGGARRAA